MGAGIKRLIGNRLGAVAPTVALALFALIGMGGIAFDYAHLAAMDTELQQAADHAALAAATQLDRADGAQERAEAAILNPGTNRLAANLTRLANDNSSSGASVEISDITFCKEFDDSIADTTEACTQTTADDDAVFVVVTTELRTANYALTPVVAAFSGTVSARAVAGVQSSVCNIAPVFVCTEDMDFPTDADVGKGLLMKTGSGNSWAPGNYGLLDFTPGGGGGNTAAIDALLGHGLNGCLDTGAVTTEPGNKNVTDAINTRMDVYAGSPQTKNASICVANGDGTGCPSPNSGKDMVIKLTATANNSTSPTPPAAKICPADPKSVTPAVSFQESASPIKGFNRDTCHYNNTCGNFGNGAWDFAGYMAANHPGVDTSTVPHVGTTPTRYEVYKWELADSSRLNQPPDVVTTSSVQKQNGRWDHTVTTQCRYRRPVFGHTNYTAQKDRRVIPVVAANCDLLNGAGNIGSDFKLIRVFDVFLTEPSLQRTSYPGPSDDKEIYGEVIGPAETFAGTTGFQYYSRSKPYLVR